MYSRIKSEIEQDAFYIDHFSNEGNRFVAWYLRRVLLRDKLQTRQEIVDGANDRKIDAVVIDDENRRVTIIQGKFNNGIIDRSAVEELFTAWRRIEDLEYLQQTGNQRLKERIEALRLAIDEEYELVFELISTASNIDDFSADFNGFNSFLESVGSFTSSFTLVGERLIEHRLAEAEQANLPELSHTIKIDQKNVLFSETNGIRSIFCVLPLSECLLFPGISDGRLFRKNVRQSLGLTNKVNKGIKQTLESERIKEFLFFHNGITAICKQLIYNPQKSEVSIKDFNVVNGCQSLTTIYKTSEKVRNAPNQGYVLFRLYEVLQSDLADKISINTNSQSAVKPRDLRSNDKVIISIKRSYESTYTDGLIINQRGTDIDGDKAKSKVVDIADLGKAIMAWHCQRPNISYNEKKIFDEYFKTVFRSDYPPASVFALKAWLDSIDEAWGNLVLNESVKATKSYSRYHVLYSISILISRASGQSEKVVVPEKTISIRDRYSTQLLNFATECINQALSSAIESATISNKPFSPQNWMKNNQSISSQKLVAGTIIGMLPSINRDLYDAIRVSPEHFGYRWNAD